MDDNFHRIWDKNLQKIALGWAKKYTWIDEEEAYSELLVWYVEACNHFDDTKGASFGTYFYFYKQKAFKSLYNLWCNKDGLAEWNIDDCLCLEDDKAQAILHNMLVELDKVNLSSAAKRMLSLILGMEIDYTKRYGKRTVLVSASKQLNWSYRKTMSVLDELKDFYGERLLA